MKGIQNLRVDYSGEIVDLKNFNKDPIIEFKSWFEFAKNNEVIEPNAMVLSTLNNNSINSRTVLLKDISSDGFTFWIIELTFKTVYGLYFLVIKLSYIYYKIRIYIIILNRI